MKPSDQVDSDVAEAINDVDWYSVNESNARSFSVSYTMFTDTKEEAKRAEALRRRTIYMGLSLMFICIVTLLFNLSTLMLTTGIAGVMIINVCFDALHVKAVESLLSVQKESLLNELSSIKKVDVVSED